MTNIEIGRLERRAEESAETIEDLIQTIQTIRNLSDELELWKNAAKIARIDDATELADFLGALP